MSPSPAPLQGNYPLPSPLLEEASVARVRDQAAAFAFALSRLPEDGRPVMAVLPWRWTSEHGRPCVQAMDGLLLLAPRTTEDALWAMEQALRSGACAGVMGAVEEASLTQTRRLDFAAREGGATAVLLRSRGGGLSAARRRWRITALPSAANPFDMRAPGRWRVHAELLRRRDGPPGMWILEQDDEAHRLRLADRLAGDGLVQNGRAIAAA